MKSKIGKIITFVTLLAPFLSSTAFGFDLYCRGPVPTASATHGRMATFKKAPQKAGPDGALLKSGECAWADRALGSAEPSTFDYDMAALGAEYVPDATDRDPVPVGYFRWAMQYQIAIGSAQELTGYYSRSDVVIAVDVVNSSAYSAFISTKFPRYALRVIGRAP